jgi:hypothetical protein
VDRLAGYCVAESGADRDRTGDPLLAKQVLSQLSYRPKNFTAYNLHRHRFCCTLNGAGQWCGYLVARPRHDPIPAPLEVLVEPVLHHLRTMADPAEPAVHRLQGLARPVPAESAREH